jgi:hypothetical protein
MIAIRQIKLLIFYLRYKNLHLKCISSSQMKKLAERKELGKRRANVCFSYFPEN